MTTNTTTGADAQRKADGLHALACIAEREGRPAAARELADWADATAQYQALADEQIQTAQRTRRTRRIGGAR